MTLIRRNENYPMFSSMFNDLLGYEWNDFNSSLPSVNVKEDENGFEVELAAPGMEKSDFKIEVNHGVLSISSQKEESKEETDQNKKYTRREFSYQSFKRSFSLPVSADSDKISAKYDRGVLVIDIPKKEEAKPKPSRTIEIG